MSTLSEDVTTKTRRIGDSASPSAVQGKASCSKLPGDVCGHCDKECTPDGEAIQCDLCYVWVHAECEGVTNEQYEKLNSIASTLCNVAYYCQLNCCHTRVKQLIASFISLPVNNSVSLAELPNEHTSQSESLSTKVVELSTQTSVLGKQISDTLNSLSKLNTVSLQSPSTSGSENSGIVPNVATNLADELIDRENRKLNLVIRNLPETTEAGSESDKNLFKSLCSVLDLTVQSFTVTRIGKKIEGKCRLLLVRLPDLVTKRQILSKSAELRSKTTWRKVYVNPDLTRSERETQKLLRDELKARKDKGETDLIIRGNRIVKRRGNRNVGQASGSSRTMVASPPPSDQHQPQSDQPMESDENNTSS